jgi:hypothetical protein
MSMSNVVKADLNWICSKGHQVSEILCFEWKDDLQISIYGRGQIHRLPYEVCERRPSEL